LIDKVTVVGLDSSNDPSKVVKMVYDAAANPNVLAVVGPMTSLEALAAADTCESVSLPMIAISQRLGLTAGRPHVFRIFLTPKHQAESVARYAVRVKGLKRFGILYPDDPYGQAMYGFFRDELARLGVGLTAVDSYGQSPTSYVDAVNRITGGHSVRKASTSFQAPVEFDALYLPDSAPVVTQLLPRIAFNDVTRVIYLGSPLWLTPDLPRSSGRYLKNSIIPEAFSSLSKRREALSFQDVFKTQTGREPDQFAAYGFDAGVALAKVISAGAGTRNEVTRSLATMGPYQGVTGPFSFDSDGDYLVEPVMLTVDERGYSLLDEPSQSR
jgi:ABC-type branched-subunit amino acid transport system substrate-binding protein